MSGPTRLDFLGVAFDQLGVAEAAAAIAARPAAAEFVHVTTPNAVHVVLLHRGDDDQVPWTRAHLYDAAPWNPPKY